MNLNERRQSQKHDDVFQQPIRTKLRINCERRPDNYKYKQQSQCEAIMP